MATVKQLYDLLDRKAPFRTQMDFDNAGFLVGRGDRTVTRVLVALDITPEAVSYTHLGGGLCAPGQERHGLLCRLLGGAFEPDPCPAGGHRPEQERCGRCV